MKQLKNNDKACLLEENPGLQTSLELEESVEGITYTREDFPCAG